jgi:hypothetical protein
MSENKTSFYKVKDDVQQAFLFRDQVKNLLYENTGVDVATVPDELAIKSLRYVLDSLQIHEDNRLNTLVDKATGAMTFRDQVMAALGNPDDAISEIERLQQSQNYVYTTEHQTLDMFWQKIQVLFGDKDMSYNDALFKIRELIHNPKKEFDCLLEEVTKLKSDLRVANKVIARLIGE